MPSPRQTVLVIGGTGAQGVPVVKALAQGDKYDIRVLTRSATSSTAMTLATLPHVAIMQGNAYDEATLHSAFQDTDLAFVNTNGFAIGEKAELYWGIRMFEIAAEQGVKHFVWASLDSVYKLSGWQARFRTGHFDGKSKVADWIAAQGKGEDGGKEGVRRMEWGVLTSCMYLETFTELLAPFPEVVDGQQVMVFQAPVGSGTPPMIYLEDLGLYAKWMFEHPLLSNGMNLKIATAMVRWEDVARTFTEVTGKKAIFRDVTLDEYFASGVFPKPDAKVGHSVGHDDATLQSYRQNFSGFWNAWRESVLVRDFELLDEILPSRVRSLGEWMRRTGYSGERGPVLKDYSDRLGRSSA